MTDRDKYPILFYTFVAMTGLLLGTFAVFWVHTLLWMFRGFVENREKAKTGAGHMIMFMLLRRTHIMSFPMPTSSIAASTGCTSSCTSWSSPASCCSP